MTAPLDLDRMTALDEVFTWVGRVYVTAILLLLALAGAAAVADWARHRRDVRHARALGGPWDGRRITTAAALALADDWMDVADAVQDGTFSDTDQSWLDQYGMQP